MANTPVSSQVQLCRNTIFLLFIGQLLKILMYSRYMLWSIFCEMVTVYSCLLPDKWMYDILSGLHCREQSLYLMRAATIVSHINHFLTKIKGVMSELITQLKRNGNQ